MISIHNKKVVSLLLIALMVVSICAGGVVALPKAAAQVAQPQTMQWQYDAARTSDYSAVAGSTQPENKVLWTYPTGSAVTSSPAVVDGVVYVGSQDHYVYALDAATGVLKWRYQTGGAVASSPAVVNDVVYVGSLDGKVYAIDAHSGTAKWPEPFTTGGGILSSPAVATASAIAKSVVYIGSNDHYVYALDADSGTQIWSLQTGDRVTSSPAVVNDVVYVGSDDNNVYARDAATGAFKWTYQVVSDQHWLGSPVVANGMLYVWNGAYYIYAIDAASGTYKWKTGYGAWDSIAVANEVMYYGTNDHYLIGVKAATGDTVMLSPIGNLRISVVESISVANGVVYATTGDNGVKSFVALYGDFLQHYAIGGYVTCTPVIVNGVMYIGSDDGNIYAIGNTPPSPPNQPPTADAGPAQSIHVGTLATLDGSQSKDADGTIKQYAWTLASAPDGSTVALSDPTIVNPTFTPDKIGAYVFSLKVTDDKGAQSTNVAQVTIMATNDPPTANAGPDQVVRVATVVTLDGRQSTDPNGDPITYAWTLVTKPHKSAALLTGGTTAQPTFTPDKTGSYTITLVVTDKYGMQSSDTVVVSVNNSKPPKPHK